MMQSLSQIEKYFMNSLIFDESIHSINCAQEVFNMFELYAHISSYIDDVKTFIHLLQLNRTTYTFTNRIRYSQMVGLHEVKLSSMFNQLSISNTLIGCEYGLEHIRNLRFTMCDPDILMKLPENLECLFIGLAISHHKLNQRIQHHRHLKQLILFCTRYEPESIILPSCLQHLILHGPAQIVLPESLQSLHLSSTSFKGIVFTDMIHLTELCISFSEKIYKIPFENMPHLQQLMLFKMSECVGINTLPLTIHTLRIAQYDVHANLPPNLKCIIIDKLLCDFMQHDAQLEHIRIDENLLNHVHLPLTMQSFCSAQMTSIPNTYYPELTYLELDMQRMTRHIMINLSFVPKLQCLFINHCRIINENSTLTSLNLGFLIKEQTFPNSLRSLIVYHSRSDDALTLIPRHVNVKFLC